MAVNSWPRTDTLCCKWEWQNTDMHSISTASTMKTQGTENVQVGDMRLLCFHIPSWSNNTNPNSITPVDVTIATEMQLTGYAAWELPCKTISTPGYHLRLVPSTNTGCSHHVTKCLIHSWQIHSHYKRHLWTSTQSLHATPCPSVITLNSNSNISKQLQPVMYLNRIHITTTLHRRCTSNT